LKLSTVSNHMLPDDSDGHEHHDSDGHDGKHHDSDGHDDKWEMIAATPCVWFKTLINLELVPDPSCVTEEDLTIALKGHGFGGVLQYGTVQFFNAALKKLEVECLDFAAIEGTTLEHVSSTGISDPIFNKDRFEEIFRGEGKKHDKSVVAMTNITAKTLSAWQDDQNERVADGEDQVGENPGTPYGVYGMIFDLFGEDVDPPEPFGKIMQYDDLKNLVEWGEAPSNVCATTLGHGQCAEVPLPNRGQTATASLIYAFQATGADAAAAADAAEAAEAAM